MIFHQAKEDQEIKEFKMPFISIFSMECTDCLKIEFFKLLKKLVIDVKGKKGDKYSMNWTGVSASRTRKTQ